MKKMPDHIFSLLVSAGDTIMDIYRNHDFGIELKSDKSPVTMADKRSSHLINQGLETYFPGIPVIDEEHPVVPYEIRSGWERFFLVDPLDGTREFIQKNGEFCINLALVENNVPAEGWIYRPLTGTGWYAAKDSGIFEFDRKGMVRELVPELKKPGKLKIIASRSFFKPDEAELINRISQNYPVEIIHRGSSLKQVALVLNQADMYIKAGPCSEWDTAAGHLMVEESGGKVFLLDNFQPLTYNKPVLVNPHFIMMSQSLNHPAFLEFIRHTLLGDSLTDIPVNI